MKQVTEQTYVRDGGIQGFHDWECAECGRSFDENTTNFCPSCGRKVVSAEKYLLNKKSETQEQQNETNNSAAIR